MKLNIRHKLRELCGNRDGASAIEAAIVFPILIGCLFAVFGMGSYMYGNHQAQRVVEKTARQTRMVTNPTEAKIQELLAANMKQAPFGTYNGTVTLINQHGGDYAELNIAYAFRFDLPFLSNFVLTTDAKTQVKLREVPV